MASEERIRGFILELNELSSRWGLVIGGCGDCGSPWVRDMDPTEMGLEAGYGFQDGGEQHLTWLSEAGTWAWQEVRPIRPDSVPVQTHKGFMWEPVKGAS